MQFVEPQTNKCQNCCLANCHIEEKKDSLHASDNLFYQEKLYLFDLCPSQKDDIDMQNTIQIQSS
jgi:hypothetical protein